ncbi:NAD-P-binding protein [Gloeopeniophorella convolvens]|nr:NAD-P-binding protein [Gloeopeniophorella convolvens]
MTRVLITGATGLVGSHVVEQALAAGYDVRALVRPSKAGRLKEIYASLGDRFETAITEDLASSDLSQAFKDVSAVIHTASRNWDTPAIAVDSASLSIENLVTAALAAGVHKLVVTMSIINLLAADEWLADRTVSAEDWNTQTRDDALKPGASFFDIYATSKVVSECVLWRLAEQHPELDVATIHPPFLYGPAARGEIIDGVAGSTNGHVYALLNGPLGRASPAQWSTPAFCHLADCARAHVLALRAPRIERPKRIVICGGYFTWRQAVRHLRGARPGLVRRLPEAQGDGEDEDGGFVYARFDVSSAEMILGMKEYIGWQETVENTVDCLVEREKDRGWEGGVGIFASYCSLFCREKIGLEYTSICWSQVGWKS